MTQPNAPTNLRFVPGSLPAAVVAAGYTQQTFGPKLNLGVNWFPYNLLGCTPLPGQAVQLPNGAISLPGRDGSNYGANICTAQKIGTSWGGFAMGDGYYVEATIAFTPTVNPPGGKLPFPGFWADEIDFLAQVGGATNWEGQIPGYQHWIELDMMQWMHDSALYIAPAGVIDWAGHPPVPSSYPQPNSLIKVTWDMAQPTRYGCWVDPATPTTQGFLMNFVNGLPVSYLVGKPPVKWNMYDRAMSSPPVAGTTAVSLIDVSHLAIIIGTDVTCPMTVYEVSVYQRNGLGNRTGPTPTTTFLTPSIATKGGADVAITVTGSNFSRLATVYWGATALATTYGNASQVFAAIPAALIASAGTATVTVHNGPYQVSNGISFVTS